MNISIINQPEKFMLKDCLKVSFNDKKLKTSLLYDQPYIKKPIVLPSYSNLVTHHDVSEEISKYIIDNLQDMPQVYEGWDQMTNEQKAGELFLTDMTAGMGCDTVTFCQYFKFINAFENNSDAYSALKHNLNIFGADNCCTYEKDSVDYVVNKKLVRQDIIYIDPPWGGSGYKDKINLRLSLGGKSIENICIELIKDNNGKRHTRTRMIALKLPNNYDFGNLRESILKINDVDIKEYPLFKMTLIVIRNYNF